MKQIRGPGGLLVWDDELFQRGDFARREPAIDVDEAGDALVGAVIRHPERAAALQKALAEKPEPKPYRPPVWAGFSEEMRDE